MPKNIDQLLQGAIDMHLHPGPDTRPRRVDALEAARQAQQVGMRAIVLKSHNYSTAPLALLISQLVPGIKIFGSICLDYEIGGLNMFALEASAKMGAKVVWMPTTSALNSRCKMNKLGLQLKGEGFSILDSKGRLVPGISGILTVIKQYNMVLASGHLSPSETLSLIEEAKKQGIQKIIITHPLDVEFMEQVPGPENLRTFIQMGALAEFTFVGLLPSEFSHSPEHTVEMIRALGAEHCILSTDLGQYSNPPPVEGMRLFIATLLKQGIDEKNIELMVKTNPGRLLGLD